MSKCVSLPGIKKVWYLNRDFLPEDVIYRSVVGMSVALLHPPTSINMIGEAVCEVEQSHDNNSFIEKVKLNFLSLDDVPTVNHPAFVFQTIDGNIYIIGSKERPYPTVKITRSTGHLDGEPSVRKYEVSFTAKKALALCDV